MAILKHALTKHLSAKAGSPVVVSIEVREGCVVLRIGGLSRKEAGELGWRSTVIDDMPSSEEVRIRRGHALL